MRLVDADELLKRALPKTPDAQFHCVSVDDIKAAPTIEPEPPKVCEKCIWMQQPERKTGRWIIDRKFGADIMSGGNMVICSECGKGIMYGKQNFCPNCGSGMREEGGE